MVEGTNSGASTTFEGTYAIKASNKDQSLKFSYIGFETQTIKIGDQPSIDVILKESLESLEEVQVVAFQKQKKNSVIGSINTISPSELKIPSSNLTNALAGKQAGMISYQRSGEPAQENAKDRERCDDHTKGSGERIDNALQQALDWGEIDALGKGGLGNEQE